MDIAAFLGVISAFGLLGVGTPEEPARTLINRMKSKGINKKLMDDFLTLNQVKDPVARDGQRGISIILPEVVGFVPGKNEITVGKAGLKVQPILSCSSLVRHPLRQLTERFLPDLVILHAAEVPRNVNIIPLGVVE